MALKKHEQLMLNNITQTATMLADMDWDLPSIEDKMKDILAGFTKETGIRLIIKQDGSGNIGFDHIDTSDYYVRTRPNTDHSLLSLRAKLDGVLIDVKVIKDEMAMSNKDIATALRELAEIVALAPVELSKQGKEDWSRTPGEPPKSVVKEMEAVEEHRSDLDEIESIVDDAEKEPEEAFLDNVPSPEQH